MCPSVASTVSTGRATRSYPARHRDRDWLLIFFVGCRSVRVAAAVVFLTDLLVRATPMVLPMSLGPIPCDLMMAQSSFRAGLDARAAFGIVRRPTVGISEAFPRPCHVVDAVRHPRQCFERDPGRGGKVTQRVGDERAGCRRASRRSVGTKSRRDGPRRAVAHQEMKGCPRSKAGGYASRSAWRLPCRGL